MSQSKWVSVTQLANDTDVLVDADSVTGEASARRVRFKVNFKQDGKPKWPGSVLSVYEYDCVERRERFIESIVFALPDGEGRVITSHSMTGPWIPVTPKHSDEVIFNFICSLPVLTGS